MKVNLTSAGYQTKNDYFIEYLATYPEPQPLPSNCYPSYITGNCYYLKDVRGSILIYGNLTTTSDIPGGQPILLNIGNNFGFDFIDYYSAPVCIYNVGATSYLYQATQFNGDNFTNLGYTIPASSIIGIQAIIVIQSNLESF